MSACAKCGGQMREGIVLVPVTVSTALISSNIGVTPALERNFLPDSEVTSDERIRWREKPQFIKIEESNTIKISGHRCLKCGYIKLHVTK